MFPRGDGEPGTRREEPLGFIAVRLLPSPGGASPGLLALCTEPRNDRDRLEAERGEVRGTVWSCSTGV